MSDKVGMELGAFKNQSYLNDKFNAKPAVLKLDDLVPYKPKTIKLSLIVSINMWRNNQLARSLETLCRQPWREFEVIVADNESPTPLEPVIEQFVNLLPIRIVKVPRSGFSACPTAGIRASLPFARGEVIAIAQPELLWLPGSLRSLWSIHSRRMPDACYYIMSGSEWTTRTGPFWPTLKPIFLDTDMMLRIDECDWHSSLQNLQNLPKLWTSPCAFGGRVNGDVGEKREWPWWFVGSAPADSAIWRDLPVFIGHASIDFWLLAYRRLLGYVDVCPYALMVIHQDHERINVAPTGEMDLVSSQLPESITTLARADSKELETLLAQYRRRPSDSDKSLLDQLRIVRDMDDRLRSVVPGVL